MGGDQGGDALGLDDGVQQAHDLLGRLGIQLTGGLVGEQHLRAARQRPGDRDPLLLADEPTGQLDSETAKQIMRLLHAVVESEGVTALVATHDPNLIRLADSVLELEDGKIKGSE